MREKKAPERRGRDYHNLSKSCMKKKDRLLLQQDIEGGQEAINLASRIEKAGSQKFQSYPLISLMHSGYEVFSKAP